jgi:TonB-linked SusC/RagA family outer membrane protein
LLLTAFSLLMGLSSTATPQPPGVLISLNLKEAPLQKAFAAIKKQTDYRVIYDNSLLKLARPVTIHVKNASLPAVLKQLFELQPFEYRMMDQTIIVTPVAPARIKQKENTTEVMNAPVRDTVITGRVITDSTRLPLEGATVIIKGSNRNAVTDKEGRFRIRIPVTGATLLISYIGYQEKNIVVNAPTTAPLFITLKETIREMQEVSVVNTGYQSLPKERATGSFTQIDNKLFNQQSGTDILSRLESITSGLSFDRKSNSAGTNIMIRGLSTIQGPKSPLIILDNFPYDGDISNLNPNDILDITVLKDAAAASIWGARAGNGVIVINTKKGQFNQPIKGEWNLNLSITGKPDLFYLKPVSSSDFVDVEQMLYNNGYFSSSLNASDHPPVSPVVEILNQQSSGAISAQTATDQINALRTHDVRNDFIQYLYRQAVNQQYALSLHGGSNSVSWIFSAGIDRDLSELKAGYNRLNVHAANTYRLTKNLDLTTDLYYTQSKTTAGRPAYGQVSTINGAIPPYTQLADKNGNALPVIQAYRQAYIDTAGAGYLQDWNYYPLTDYTHITNTSKIQDVLAHIILHYKLGSGFSTDINYQYEKQSTSGRILYDLQSYYARDLINTFTQIDRVSKQITYLVPLGDILDLSQIELVSQNIRGQLNYTGNWQKNSLTAIAGGEIKQAHTLGNSNRNYGYDDANLTFGNVDYANPYSNFVTGSNTYIPNENSLSDQLNRYVSLYANAAYTYSGKYTASISGRRDASNLFGVNTNQKWNPLWSAGLAWNLTKEAFFRVSFLNDLKLRATYGVSGNVDQSKSAVTTLTYIGSSPYTQSPLARINQYSNPDLRWERVRMFNIGIDFKALSNRLSGSIEYYHKKGIDLFGNSLVDYTAVGTNTITKNVASMIGNGADIELHSVNINRTVQWTSDLNLSFYRDKVITAYLSSLQGSNFINGGTSIAAVPGKPVYSVFSYRWKGLDPITGDPQGFFNGAVSKDYTSLTGSATQVSDLVYNGPAYPTWYGSLGNTITWKQIAVTVRLLYKFGYYFQRSSINYSNLFASRQGHADYAKRWQKTGDEKWTNVPSLVYPAVGSRDAFYNGSSVLVDKGDNIRLQYVTFSYNITRQQIFRLPFNNCQVYVNLNNLGILWRANKDGLDPDYLNYVIPPSKNIIIGIRADF